MYVYTPGTRMMPVQARRGCQSPGSGVRDGYEPIRVLGREPWQEQRVYFSTEPTLQPSPCFLIQGPLQELGLPD